MKFEFKKSKYPLIKYAFLTLIAYAVVMIISIYCIYKNELYIPQYSSVNSEISLNLTLKDKTVAVGGMFACAGGSCQSFESDVFNNVNRVSFSVNDEAFYNKKTDKILIASMNGSDNIKNAIKTITLHVGTKDYYFNEDDISKFEIQKKKIAFDPKDENEDRVEQKGDEFSMLVLPDSVKSNYKGVYNQICCFILSLFYNWQVFKFPYICLFIAFVIYVYKKDEININFSFSKKTYAVTLGLVGFLAVFLRLNLFNYYPLWIDEIYVKTQALASLKGCFSDPGNPPLFYIIEYIFTRVFGTSDVALRFLPFVFGCFVPYVAYLLFKDINKNTALFAFAFCALNTICIYHSIEARSYSLCMLLSLLMIYYLFRWLKDFQKKDFIIYSLLAFCSINTYFYLAVLVLSNFIWGIFDLLETKKIKEIKQFSFMHLGVVLTFVPYLIYTFKNSMNAGFNSWIPKISTESFIYIAKEYFLNLPLFWVMLFILTVMLVFVYLPEKYLSETKLEKNDEKEKLFMYLVYSLAFIIITLTLISLNIKPILHKRLLLSLYGLFLMLQVVSISTIFDFKKDINLVKVIKGLYSVVLVFVCFTITKPMNVKNIYRLDPFVHFVVNDSKEYHNKGYEVHVLISAKESYMKHFIKDNEYDYLKLHFTETTSGEAAVDEIKKEDYMERGKRGVLYLTSLSADTSKEASFNPNYYAYLSNTSPNNYIKIIF